ncbi:hypothetical protein Tco_0859234 [Tanacetum coccineum]|uniref:Uncharacterized protein n=1 Tax=Tanacetum coccineum TaxID=301880 RepID=A0ABQ5BEQ3_9ASTR
MAQPQRPADVHQDDLCPPNKHYALMNKKIDLDNPHYLNESKIMANIIQNHPLRFSIVASSSVPWIYLGQFWHTLQEDGLKYRLKFLRSPSNFKTTGLVQPWQTLGKIFARCLTTRVTGHDQPPLQIMQIARVKYHNLENDAMVKNIFNSGKHKDGFGMKVPSWMITDEMKLTNHYQMTLSAPRSPNLETDEGESSAPLKSTVIRLCIPQRRSTQLTPPTPIPTTAEADDIILQDTIQLSLAEQKSHEELEAKQNVQKVEEHLIAEDIEKLVEGTENEENVEVNSSTLRQDDTQNIPGTRLEPMSDKESLEVEITTEAQPVYINEEEEESAEDDYELKRREKGKHVEESRSTPSPTTIRSPRIHSTLVSLDTEKLQELTVTDPPPSFSTPSSSLPKLKISATNRLLSLFKPKPGRFKRYKSFFDELQGRYGYLFERLKTRPSVVRPRDQDDPHDVAHPKGENSEKRQKTSEHETFVFRESSSGQDFKSKPGPSTSDNQEQLDYFDFGTDSYATDDDEIPNEKVSQELVDEMLHTVDEAKLHKVVDEMLRQRCTSEDEHQYHIDQMQNFLKKDIVWESRKEIIRGNSGPEKIVLSLHKFPAVIFPDDDIEERTSRWKQKEPGKPKEAVYSNSKIIQMIKTYWELRHEHKFITEIIARRANDIIVSITESDYKNLNKNDIEDMYLLVINNKVDDYAETNNLTAPTITFSGIKKYKMFSIVSEPVVLEGLKSYNNDVKHEYVTQSLSNEYAEYLQLFMEEIEERLKHRDQMRRWEMYVNGRPLGSRRERPE